MKLAKVLFLPLLLLSQVVASSDKIILAASSSIPPYIISAENRGIVLDTTTAAFLSQGYHVEYILAPNKRVEKLLLNAKVDGMLSSSGSLNNNLYSSDVSFSLKNVVVSLKHRELVIEKVQDLESLNIVSYQNSGKVIGGEYQRLISSNANYTEVTNQSAQIDMLFLDRADVIVLDEKIFKYYLNRYKLNHKKMPEYTIHAIFPQSPRYMIYRDKYIRDIFNQGLSTIRSSGKYQAIVDSYIEYWYKRPFLYWDN